MKFNSFQILLYSFNLIFIEIYRSTSENMMIDFLKIKKELITSFGMGYKKI